MSEQPKRDIALSGGKDLTSTLVSEGLLQTLSNEERQALAKVVLEKKIDLEFEAARNEVVRQNAEVTLQTFDRRVKDIDLHSDKSDVLVRREEKVTVDIPNGSISSRYSRGACFVATATYKNPYHPDVEYLRKFRDQYLVKRKPGRLFIEWYYRKSGPYMASIIKHYPVLRYMCLATLKGAVAVLRTICPTK